MEIDKKDFFCRQHIDDAIQEATETNKWKWKHIWRITLDDFILCAKSNYQLEEGVALQKPPFEKIP
jgi:hypothetical protein